jgi:hypothetical protein
MLAKRAVRADAGPEEEEAGEKEKGVALGGSRHTGTLHRTGVGDGIGNPRSESVKCDLSEQAQRDVAYYLKTLR